MAAPDDLDTGGGGDVERYEALRRQALAGAESGWRLGLALLQRQGVAAWARAWRDTVRPEPSRPVPIPVGGADEVVGVLAGMALACLRAR